MWVWGLMLMSVPRREYVASYPDGVVAVRLSSSRAGGVDVVCSLERDRWVLGHTAAVVHEDGLLALVANASDQADPIRFTAEARIVADGGGYGFWISEEFTDGLRAG